MVALALSRSDLLTILHTTITAYDQLKELYEFDEDFAIQWQICVSESCLTRYKIQGGLLLHDDRLCISRTSLKLQLIHEAHSSGLNGHFRSVKTILQIVS